METHKLSDQQLEQDLSNLVGQERKLLHLILVHIKEFDGRKLYLKSGRSSLFEYLLKDLGYSAASAQRRIEGARLIREIPEVAEKIRTGSLHLSHVGEIVRAVKQKEQESLIRVNSTDKLALIESVERKSVSETQKSLALSLNIELKPREQKTLQRDDSIHLSLTLSKEEQVLFERCKNLASHELLKQGGVGYGDVFAYLMKFYLKQRKSNSTSEAEVESKKIQNLDSSADIEKAPTDLNESAKSLEPLKTKKTVTPKTRKLIRMQYQHCQHRNRDGSLCKSEFLLEVDHKVPRWAGGGHEATNLQLLCANHNRAKYRSEAGIT